MSLGQLDSPEGNGAVCAPPGLENALDPPQRVVCVSHPGCFYENDHLGADRKLRDGRQQRIKWTINDDLGRIRTDDDVDRIGELEFWSQRREVRDDYISAPCLVDGSHCGGDESCLRTFRNYRQHNPPGSYTSVTHLRARIPAPVA